LNFVPLFYFSLLHKNKTLFCNDTNNEQATLTLKGQKLLLFSLFFNLLRSYRVIYCLVALQEKKLIASVKQWRVTSTAITSIFPDGFSAVLSRHCMLYSLRQIKIYYPKLFSQNFSTQQREYGENQTLSSLLSLISLSLSIVVQPYHRSRVFSAGLSLNCN
jgi:hypothetical protein